MLTIYANVFSCQVSFHATPDSKKKMSGIYWVEKLGVPIQTQITTAASSAEKPVHLSLSLFSTSTKSSGECLSIPKPAGRYNPSIMSPVCLWAPCQMGMPQTPPRGSVRKASLPDAIQPQHFQQNFKKKKMVCSWVQWPWRPPPHSVYNVSSRGCSVSHLKVSTQQSCCFKKGENYIQFSFGQNRHLSESRFFTICICIIL